MICLKENKRLETTKLKIITQFILDPIRKKAYLLSSTNRILKNGKRKTNTNIAKRNARKQTKLCSLRKKALS